MLWIYLLAFGFIATALLWALNVINDMANHR